MRASSTTLVVCIAIFLAMSSAPAWGQLVIQETLTITGTVESVSPGVIVVKDEKGAAHEVRIQDKDAQGVALSGGQLLRFPAQVEVTGNLGVKSLTAGKNVRFQAKVNRLGRTQGKVEKVTLVSGEDGKDGVTVVTPGKRPADYSMCEIVGQVTRLARGRLVIGVPAGGEFTRKTALSFQVADDLEVLLASDDYNRAAPGSKVTRLIAARLNTGDLVARELKVEVNHQTTKAESVDEKLLAKYRKLSDEPTAPRMVRSAHFMFMTDVSDRQAQIILDKLEVMATLLTKYFGQAPSGVVEGFIVRDLSKWPEGTLKEPQGIDKIREGAGICFNHSLGNRVRAELYSCDDHGVIQHECTHGFCHLAFGSTGPTWLAEGVAEMGQYWKVDKRAIDISPIVMSYLQQAKPKRKLLEIAIPGRTDSGTWRDYAWRWALCHLLSNNPNYESRFKPLAIALMKKQEGVSFAAVYGPVADQVSFEYDLFLKTLDNGYRADLVAWNWNAKFKPLQGSRRTQMKIKSGFGWQTSALHVEKGVSYDIAAIGKWKISQDGSEIDADGDKDGRGKLVGVIFKDYKLSDPIPLGKSTTMVAPADGDLFLRCQDDWNKLEDNSGEVTVHFRRTPSQ